MTISEIAGKWGDYASIMDSADILGLSLDVQPSSPIKLVAEAYSKAVLANLESVLRMLGRTELEVIKELAAKDDVYIHEDTLYPASMSLFLLDYEEDGMGFCKLLIPSDLAGKLPVIEKVVSDAAYQKDADQAQFIVGMVNVYGMIRKQELVSLLSSLLTREVLTGKGDEGIDVDAVAESMFWADLDHSAALHLAMDDGIMAPEGDFWLVSPYLDEPEKVLEERSRHADLSGYKDGYSLSDFFDAGDALFPFFPNKAADMLSEFLLNDMKMDYEEMEVLLTHFWLSNQYDGSVPTEMVQMFSKACKDEKSVSKMMDVIMGYCNLCPIWSLKGHTPTESASASAGSAAKPPGFMPPFGIPDTASGSVPGGSFGFPFGFPPTKEPKS